MNSLPLRKTLALICAILFVPSLAFTLVTSNLEKSLFSPALYKDALKASQVYQRLPGLIADQLAANASQQGGISAMFLRALPPDALQNLFVSILPADAVQRLVEQSIDQAFASLNVRGGAAAFSLGGLKQELAANSGGLVDQYFSTLPDCGLADVLNLAGGLLEGGDLPRCNPPDAVKDALSVPVRAAIEEQLNQALPDNLALGTAGGGLQGLLAMLRLVRTAAILTPVLALVFFGAMTLLAVRSVWELLRWWGWPLLMGGLISMVAGLLIAPAATSLLDATLIARLSAAMGPAIAALLSTVAGALAAGLVRPIILDALLVTALGGALLIAARFAPQEATA